jgi:hypothetical protein
MELKLTSPLFKFFRGVNTNVYSYYYSGLNCEINYIFFKIDQGDTFKTCDIKHLNIDTTKLDLK